MTLDINPPLSSAWGIVAERPLRDQFEYIQSMPAERKRLEDRWRKEAEKQRRKHREQR